MELTATIGPLRFRYRSANTVHLSPLALRPLLVASGDPVSVLERGEPHTLVIDHRTQDQGLARVETWELDGPTEAAVRRLLVLSDALLTGRSRDAARRQPTPAAEG